MNNVPIVRHTILVFVIVLIAFVCLTRPPLAQDPAYHLMADQRTLLSIPNFFNVLSNLPFLFVGLLGLAAVFHRGDEGATLFRDRWERWPYVVLFTGITVTAFGSAYYHLQTNNARLVWDRLPMTLGFMGLLAALLAERVSLRVGRLLLGPLLLFGIGSVVYWHWSELGGVGDLRPYILVQFGSLVVVLLLLILYPARYRGAGYLWAGLGLYAGAKLLEVADARIFALGQIVSGHTLKHLAAAAGAACLVAMLRTRIGKSQTDLTLGGISVSRTKRAVTISTVKAEGK